jgi:transcriptional regulator
MPGRRQFLTSIPLAAAATADGADAGTIYIPDRHKEADRRFLTNFLEDYSFAMVVTAHGGLQISNVPTLHIAANDNWGKIWWHLAKSNGQNEVLAKGGEATLVFRGPHSYISPNWYENGHAVPTWNFAVVHATGKVERRDDDGEFAQRLSQLVDRNEKRYAAGETKWKLADLPENYLKGMRQGIVAYEITIESVEAKFKLGQERIDGDRQGVLAALESGKGREPGIAVLTRRYYAMRQK